MSVQLTCINYRIGLTMFNHCMIAITCLTILIYIYISYQAIQSLKHVHTFNGLYYSPCRSYSLHNTRGGAEETPFFMEGRLGVTRLTYFILYLLLMVLKKTKVLYNHTN